MHDENQVRRHRSLLGMSIIQTVTLIIIIGRQTRLPPGDLLRNRRAPYCTLSDGRILVPWYSMKLPSLEEEKQGTFPSCTYVIAPTMPRTRPHDQELRTAETDLESNIRQWFRPYNIVCQLAHLLATTYTTFTPRPQCISKTAS